MFTTLIPSVSNLRGTVRRGCLVAVASWCLASCSDTTEEPVEVCEFDLSFAVGDDGHTDPLGSLGPGLARAGRITAGDLPHLASGLAVWSPGDFVLANERVAMIIEDVGHSDLYDPWGGRPVGITSVEDRTLVNPADFGEFFILTGRQSVLTTSVSVLDDGSDGGPAVIRATGRPVGLPFYENLIGVLLRDDYGDMQVAIDYVLEPDSDHVDIYVLYHSPRLFPTQDGVALHGFMYTGRMPSFAPGVGFDTEGVSVDMLAFVDEDATSYAYSIPGVTLRAAISASGFTSNFADPFEIQACGETVRHYARITIGQPGLDGVLLSVARSQDTQLRALSGQVSYEDGTPIAGARVHATDANGDYLTRVKTDPNGAFALHVPTESDVELTVWRRGDAVVGPIPVAPEVTDNIALTVPLAGFIQVQAVDDDTSEPLPVRIQVFPVSEPLPSVPEHYGEHRITGGRLHVEFAMDGQALLRTPPGEWEVVVSRGYEYELHREVVTVSAGQTVDVQARIQHVVDTTGIMCGDFHIHTHRSADSGDDAREKLRSGIADGLEIPVRTEHEFVDDFQPLIEEFGLQDWAYGVGSIEMTSFEVWGHMGVFPLEPDPSMPNAGAPLWQDFPSASDPDREIETLLPPVVFNRVRARPEQPVVIINHPRRSSNYFDIAGYDTETGTVDRPEYWDEEFQLVEIFNSASWLSERDELVADWLSFLNQGRRIFAIGSSDSHRIRGTPLGYPRTCIELGTDNPRDLTPELVRDNTHAGHTTISGGVYVYASVNGVGPGGDAIGVPADTTVSVRVEAASWIDVDWIEIVVDGETVDTIGILPGDADPTNPAVRFQGDIPIQVAAGFGSYVIVAAYGDSALDPVHPGQQPFGVTNPIFMMQ